ncbi:alpha-aspartyl dipeptidase-like isoform X1 [Chrysemys picta bellii]|uniref:alpha-aspartyl dipeptidase-like isoform X1 n=1 Tax=Chrysemys picta bellii TaxID=8478 RepID=UPI0032B183DD
MSRKVTAKIAKSSMAQAVRAAPGALHVPAQVDWQLGGLAEQTRAIEPGVVPPRFPPGPSPQQPGPDSAALRAAELRGAGPRSGAGPRAGFRPAQRRFTPACADGAPPAAAAGVQLHPARRRVPGPLRAASQELLRAVGASARRPRLGRLHRMTRQKVKRVLFIPYALHDRDAYAKTAREKFESLGYGLDSIHESSDPVAAVRKSEAIFIGGGNTFRLLKALYDNSLLQEIRKRVLEDGIPYMGSSAGTNVATISINTTNDMPIVYPPSLQALGLVPFNINPHYLDPDVNSTHMGETRAERILQYHEEPNTPPVLGLREGAMLLVEGDKATLQGVTGARLFLRGEKPTEHQPGTDFSFLLTDSNSQKP